jgi:hypothetical protein
MADQVATLLHLLESGQKENTRLENDLKLIS